MRAMSTGSLYGYFAVMAILSVVLIFNAPEHRLVQTTLGSTAIASDALQSKLPLAVTFADHDIK